MSIEKEEELNETKSVFSQQSSTSMFPFFLPLIVSVLYVNYAYKSQEIIWIIKYAYKIIVLVHLVFSCTLLFVLWTCFVSYKQLLIIQKNCQLGRVFTWFQEVYRPNYTPYDTCDIYT